MRSAVIRVFTAGQALHAGSACKLALAIAITVTIVAGLVGRKKRQHGTADSTAPTIQTRAKQDAHE